MPIKGRSHIPGADGWPCLCSSCCCSSWVVWWMLQQSSCASPSWERSSLRPAHAHTSQMRKKFRHIRTGSRAQPGTLDGVVKAPPFEIGRLTFLLSAAICVSSSSCKCQCNVKPKSVGSVNYPGRLRRHLDAVLVSNHGHKGHLMLKLLWQGQICLMGLVQHLAVLRAFVGQELCHLCGDK